MLTAEIEANLINGTAKYTAMVRSKRGELRGVREFWRSLDDAVAWAQSWAPTPKAMRIMVDGSPLMFDKYGFAKEPSFRGASHPEFGGWLG